MLDQKNSITTHRDSFHTRVQTTLIRILSRMGMCAETKDLSVTIVQVTRDCNRDPSAQAQTSRRLRIHYNSG
jgi:hypothetical protein